MRIPSTSLNGLRGRAPMGRRTGAFLLAVVTVVSASGCASNYSPRADLSTVETIGVVVPPGSSEPSGAEDVMQLYNLSVGEDRLKNSAVGAGAGTVGKYKPIIPEFPSRSWRRHVAPLLTGLTPAGMIYSRRLLPTLRYRGADGRNSDYRG